MHQAAEALVEDDIEEAMEERALLEQAEQKYSSNFYATLFLLNYCILIPHSSLLSPRECEHRVEIWKSRFISRLKDAEASEDI